MRNEWCAIRIKDNIILMIDKNVCFGNSDF